MEPAFFVSEFPKSKENTEDFAIAYLSILIKQCFAADFSDIKDKIQIKNIVSLLRQSHVHTIVCEREYIDRDFSEDFANYYVQGFKNYRDTCARFHFFRNEFDHEKFDQKLHADNEDTDFTKQLQENYLGFLVVKPLPFTFLGRTCIKKPEQIKVNRRHSVNLFGVALQVEAIAFQEQDRVVSACATTAVWSLMHALPEIHNKQIPSPSAITLAATGSPLQNVNGFPNKGLNLTQITTALESFGLRQHSFPIFRFDNDRFFRDFLSAYLDSGIPVFLGAKIYKQFPTNGGKTKGYYLLGDHAVVVLGAELCGKNGMRLIVHDDRIGPYICADSGKAKIYESTSDKGGMRSDGFFLLDTQEFLVPTAALVATFPKKKIGADLIIETAKNLLQMLQKFYPADHAVSTEAWNAIDAAEYSVTLHEAHALKEGYFSQRRNASVTHVLLAHLPHFIWKIHYKMQGQASVDFLFDATSPPNGNPYIAHVILQEEYGSMFFNGISAIARSARENDQFDRLSQASNNSSTFTYHVNVMRKLAPPPLTQMQYLSKTYGPLRPPKYLKDTKFALFRQTIDADDPKDRHRFFSKNDAAKFSLEDFMNRLDKASKGIAIWVIDEEGALLIGPDHGHPNLTDANPARIAGELTVNGNTFVLNANSGRYSKHRLADDVTQYLRNAAEMWRDFFPDNQFCVDE